MITTKKIIPSAVCTALSLILITGCGTPEQPAQPERLPNVLMIMIDDLGWTDLHIQGNDRLETPVIDQLGAEGMRFTDNYAASPVCSPTRAAVITGQSPARLAITNHITGNQDKFQPEGVSLRAAEMYNYLGLDYVTLAERLKGAGYATAFLGKWHLSGTRDEMSTVEPGRRPEFQGFDVLTATDVTEQAVVSVLKDDLFRKEAMATREKVEQLQRRLRSLLGEPDLELGLISLQRDDLAGITTAQAIGRSLMMKDTTVARPYMGKSLYAQAVERLQKLTP